MLLYCKSYEDAKKYPGLKRHGRSNRNMMRHEVILKKKRKKNLNLMHELVDKEDMTDYLMYSYMLMIFII
jgi:hypothetical protein